LANSFITMVRERRSERFDGWIGQAMESHIPELKAFAKSLTQDQQAVVAALTYEWNDGIVEGHVNRLKLVKSDTTGSCRTTYRGRRSCQADRRKPRRSLLRKG
jgi:transposase